MKVRIQGILKAGERFEETIEVPDEIGCGRTVFLKVTSPFPPRP